MTVDILSIDVSSELETLCRAQLRGTWQIPAELIRLAERLGAAEVSLNRYRRGFEIQWNGSPVDFGQLANLRTALDAKSPADDRQRAITAIEDSKMEALLWASGLRGAHIQVVARDTQHISTFKCRQCEKPKLYRHPATDGPNSVEIQWRCAGLDRKRALRWLEIATRFVRTRVVIDGNPAPKGFAGGLFHVRIEEPLPFTLGLTRSGDRPVLWLLRDGVVSARASVPGYPPFEAAVELGGVVETGASAADMRRAVTPFLSELVDRAVWMMVEVTDRLSALSPEDRDRHCLSLLRAARKGLRRNEICRLPLLQNAGDDRRLSVDALRLLAEKAGGTLPAIGQSEVDIGLVDPKSILVASGEVRELLTELTGIRFQAPARRNRRRITRVLERIRELFAMVSRRVRGLLAGRELASDELQPGEIVVLAAMKTALSPVDIRLCVGREKAGRTSRGVVAHRHNPVTAAGFDLIGSDSAWLYPFILALDCGLDPAEDLRRNWLQVAGSTSRKS